MQVSDVVAQRISDRMNRYGYPLCIPADVQKVAEGGSTEDVGLDEAIQNEINELGLGGELKHSVRRINVVEEFCTCPMSIRPFGHSIACPLYKEGA